LVPGARRGRGQTRIAETPDCHALTPQALDAGAQRDGGGGVFVARRVASTSVRSSIRLRPRQGPTSVVLAARPYQSMLHANTPPTPARSCGCRTDCTWPLRGRGLAHGTPAMVTSRPRITVPTSRRLAGDGDARPAARLTAWRRRLPVRLRSPAPCPLASPPRPMGQRPPPRRAASGWASAWACRRSVGAARGARARARCRRPGRKRAGAGTRR